LRKSNGFLEKSFEISVLQALNNIVIGKTPNMIFLVNIEIPRQHFF